MLWVSGIKTDQPERDPPLFFNSSISQASALYTFTLSTPSIHIYSDIPLHTTQSRMFGIPTIK